VRLTARSSLADVAVSVGDALRRAGIRAVLTGGPCAHLYSGGVYLSRDADFVLAAPCSRENLDRALATVGFKRDRDRYVHAVVPFFVEFPRGPLGIGEDRACNLTGHRQAVRDVTRGERSGWLATPAIRGFP
jgi:hypothetical protein